MSQKTVRLTHPVFADVHQDVAAKAVAKWVAAGWIPPRSPQTASEAEPKKRTARKRT